MPQLLSLVVFELRQAKIRIGKEKRAIGSIHKIIRGIEPFAFEIVSDNNLFAVFAEAIAGRKLDRRSGQQALCYGAGDYAGPHNDHHPENKRAAKGYLDLHLSLSSPSVDHQYLVYAKGGHFTEMVPVAGLGTLTIYRLPFWHYTTPLQAKTGQEAKARRWVLLATYLYQPDKNPA